MRDVKCFILSVGSKFDAAFDWPFFKLHDTLFYEMCKVDIKYTDTKNYASNILYFDVNVAFYVLSVLYLGH